MLFTKCDAFGRVGSKVNQKTNFTFPPLKDSSQCKITREGTFQYLKDDGSIDTTVLIVRKGSEQIEYTENKKYYSSYKLSWVNECEYNLTFIKTNQESSIFKKGDSMNARIIYIEGNTIYMEATFKTFIHKGAIIKIK